MPSFAAAPTAAGARVVRRDEDEARRQREDTVDAGDRDRPRVDRASQGIQRIDPELECLVQEERAAVPRSCTHPSKVPLCAGGFVAREVPLQDCFAGCSTQV